jgi:ribokinase
MRSNHPSVCIIGNLNIDLIIRNVPDLPGWGQEVMGTDRLQVSSGQAGYLAFALQKLGISTHVIGNVGVDLYGKQILDDLNTAGVDTHGVLISPGDTGISVAVVRTDGERCFISELGCLREFDQKIIADRWNLVELAEIVCLVGLFCIPGLSFADAARQLERARAAGKTTMLDTGWDPANWKDATLAGMQELLKHVSLFMPNWDEARAITRADTVDEAAKRLQDFGPEIVVIKCGEEGSYARRGSETHQAPPRPVQVHDAVGAGDVFNSGFLYGLIHDWPLEACLAFGNSSASLYISRKVDRFPGLKEVTAAAQEYPIFNTLKLFPAKAGEKKPY